MDLFNRLEAGITKVVDEVGGVLSNARSSIIASIDRERVFLERDLANNRYSSNSTSSSLRTKWERSPPRRFSFSDAENGSRRSNIPSVITAENKVDNDDNDEEDEETARIAFDTAVLLGTRTVLLKRLRDVALANNANASNSDAVSNSMDTSDAVVTETDSVNVNNNNTVTNTNINCNENPQIVLSLETIRKDVIRVNAELIRLHSRIRTRTGRKGSSSVRRSGGRRFRSKHQQGAIDASSNLASQLKEHAGNFPPPLQPSSYPSSSAGKNNSHRSFSSPPSVMMSSYNNTTSSSSSNFQKSYNNSSTLAVISPSSVKDLTQVVADYKTAAAKLDAMIASAGLSLSNNDNDDDEREEQEDVSKVIENAGAAASSSSSSIIKDDPQPVSVCKTFSRGDHVLSDSSAIMEIEEEEEGEESRNSSNDNSRNDSSCDVSQTALRQRSVIDSIITRTASPFIGRNPLTPPSSLLAVSQNDVNIISKHNKTNSNKIFGSPEPALSSSSHYHSSPPISIVERIKSDNSRLPLLDAEASLPCSSPESQSVARIKQLLFPSHEADEDEDDEGRVSRSISSSSVKSSSKDITPSRVATLFVNSNNTHVETIEEENINTSTSSSSSTFSSSSLNDSSANQSMTRARKAIDALKELSRAILPHPHHIPSTSNSASLFSSAKKAVGLGEGSTSSLSVSWSTADGLGEEKREGGLITSSALTKLVTNVTSEAEARESMPNPSQTASNNHSREEEEEEGSSSLSFNVSDDGSSISTAADVDVEEEQMMRLVAIEEDVVQGEINQQNEEEREEKGDDEQHKDSEQNGVSDDKTNAVILPPTESFSELAAPSDDDKSGRQINNKEEKEEMMIPSVYHFESSTSTTSPHRSSSSFSSNTSLALLHHLSPISSIMEETSSSPQRLLDLKDHHRQESDDAEEVPPPTSSINNSGRFSLFSPNRNSGPVRALASQAPPQALAAAAAAAAVTDNKLLTLAALTSSPHVARRLQFFNEDPYPRFSSTGMGGVGSPSFVRGHPHSNVTVNLPSSPSSSSHPPELNNTPSNDIVGGTSIQSLLSSESVFVSQTMSPHLALSGAGGGGGGDKREGEVGNQQALSSVGAKDKLFAALDAAARLLPSLIPAPASSSSSSLSSVVRNVSPRSQKRSALHLIGRGGVISSATSSSSTTKSSVDVMAIATTPNPSDNFETSTPSSAASDPVAPTPPITLEASSASRIVNKQSLSDEPILKSAGIASPNIARRTRTTTSPSSFGLVASASPAQKSASKPPRPSSTGGLSSPTPPARNSRIVAITKGTLSSSSSSSSSSTSTLRAKLNEFKVKPVERKLTFQSPDKSSMMIIKKQRTKEVATPSQDPTRLLIL